MADGTAILVGDTPSWEGEVPVLITVSSAGRDMVLAEGTGARDRGGNVFIHWNRWNESLGDADAEAARRAVGTVLLSVPRRYALAGAPRRGRATLEALRQGIFLGIGCHRARLGASLGIQIPGYERLRAEAIARERAARLELERARSARARAKAEPTPRDVATSSSRPIVRIRQVGTEHVWEVVDAETGEVLGHGVANSRAAARAAAREAL
ncbi:MAG: hypothetical protein ABIK89_05010 [Planctomycetota bacterium]